MPEKIYDNPVNYYSVIHFAEYFIFSFLKFFTLNRAILISLFWEFAELLISYDWARESWANKIIDIYFNLSGFYFGQKFFSKWSDDR
tara:strand:+ start:698 stop:958 length:261 start_codon:yes stop_codon:yes gene_type:complete